MKNIQKGPLIISGNAHHTLAEDIASYIGQDLTKAEVFKFNNDNTFVKILENVRERDVFIIQPTAFPVNDNIMELLIMIDAAKRASAGRITAVIPYFSYARTDKKDQPRVPITGRLIADLITTAGSDRVMMMDLHAGQVQGFFSATVDELTALPILASYFVEKKLDDSIQSYSDRLSLSENALTSVSENYSNIQSRISSAKQTKEKLTQRISDLTSRNNIISSEVSTNESHLESLLDRIGIVEQNYASGEQTRIASELSKINIKKSDIEKLYTSIMNDYRDKSSQLTTMQTQDNREKSQTARLSDEENSLHLESEQIESKIDDLEKQKDPKREILEGLRQKEQELISTSGSSIGEVQEIDSKLKTLTEKDMDLTKQINNFERQSDSLNRDLHDLIENEVKLQQILSAFGFDKDMETFDVEPIVQGLTSELTSLNALNAKAPETYLEVSYGYRSMSVRKNSLEEERNSIVKFIEDIEKDKRQTFLDAFDKVDKEIRLIFNKMTGGNAWLELQNEDDIFNSGISYLIQFPNKPKRESTSISGGEKTLAAIVFVLALQKLKPSPFYLFDEVDAHLDAPNAERLSTILEERSKESQFIMVSLKDSVIQKAKLIYGVFPKNGVSNVVTYKDKRVPSVKTS